ncbi:MAG: CAP domain-containing protein [Hyphomicrobiaceae bacterium]|nr:CAP domain-containing protein [Hyphomicrobiaceae bacterium]
MAAALPDVQQVETAIVQMTNAYRQEQKLSAVAPSPALAAAARAYAEYLARTNTFAHDADGRSHADRVSAAGYEYCEVSENLARSVDSRGFTATDLARTTVEGWINSPGHRRNIEAPAVTETGVAVARVPDQHPKFVAVQLFARPRALAFDVQIANSTKAVVVYTLAGRQHDLAPHMAATHTLCAPSDVAFERAGSGSRAVSLALRYETAKGQVFVIEPGKDGKPTVTIDKKRQIK